MKLENDKKAIFAMLLLSAIYGLAGYTARVLQTHFGVWQQLAIQSWLAFVLLESIQSCLSMRPRFQRLSWQHFKSLLSRAVVGRLVSSYFFIQACLYAPLGNVGWISALPTSVLFGWGLFGQCVTKRDWILLTISMVGVGIIVAPEIDLRNVSGQGELYAFVSVLASGLAALFGRSAAKERGAIVATSWVMLFTAVLATMAAIFFEGGLKIPPTSALPMLGLASVMVGLGAVCSMYGFTYLRASTATALLSLEAVWAVGLGLMIYGETPTINSLVGGVVIVVVAYLIAPSRKVGATTGRN